MSNKSLGIIFLILGILAVTFFSMFGVAFLVLLVQLLGILLGIILINKGLRYLNLEIEFLTKIEVITLNFLRDIFKVKPINKQ